MKEGLKEGGMYCFVSTVYSTANTKAKLPNFLVLSVIEYFAWFQNIFFLNLFVKIDEIFTNIFDHNIMVFYVLRTSYSVKLVLRY